MFLQKFCTCHSELKLKVSRFCPSFRFLLQSLEDLDSSLRKLNSRLFVIRGQPTDVFPRLFKVTAATWPRARTFSP